MKSKFSFVLYNEEGRNVFKDHRTLEMSVTTEDALDSWKASFLVAGVMPQNDEERHAEATGENKQAEDNLATSVDPHLERQVSFYLK